MIVLEVKLNGELIAKAGKSDLCVLNTIVDGVGVLGADSAGTKSEKEGYKTSLSVGGLGVTAEDEPGTHYSWVGKQIINVGDEVSIKFLESENAHDPKIVRAYTPEEKEKEMKLRWETSRDYYLKYKDKYE